MLLSLLTPITRTVSTSSRRFFSARRVNPQMSSESLSLIQKRKHANFRVINVSGFKTDLMEIPSHDPALHVLFIPGNPGVISFYTDFLELLYESLGGTASVTGKPFNSTALSHEPRNWESGRLFSLQEQIDHKIRKQAPDARLEVEREGHTHAFSCSEAGSVWVAQHVSSLIKSYIQTAKSYQSRM
ncbi:UNVERIFIED_CONTAM: hypothetical protein Scaly_1980300 [Sesamum calycinum]|uniref:Uncharacterized protein n=1 Tax=Sesamum calycinum TaxID=2727403 RepID=A0AAW2MZA9_9LAMI